ncbi:MAG: nitroreductase family protein [Planctomycetota bacterium]|nr:nitroreductase family protein [Planctomycetota bacterium]
MRSTLKNIIAGQLGSLPGVSRLFYRYYVYRVPLDEKGLRGLIQKRGHSIDLRLGSGEGIPRSLIKNLEFLFREVRRRNMLVDEPLRWALELLAMAKCGLRPAPEAVAPPPRAGCGALPEETALAAVIRGRRSVRQWSSEPVNADEIIAAIDVAKWAPSSCNRQVWQALLIERADDVTFLRDYFAGAFYAQAPLLVLVLAKTALYGPSERHFAYLDGAAFIQNLLLVLHAKGYGACWLGFTGWNSLGGVLVAEEKVRVFYEYFNLTRDQVPVSLVAVGRPASTPKAPPRQGIDNIVLRRR